MKKTLLFAVAASVALAGCVKNDPANGGTVASDAKISFDAPAVGAVTRAVAGEIVNPYNKAEHFTVYALHFADEYTSFNDGAFYMAGVETAYDPAGNCWNSESVTGGKTYYWPKNGSLTFQAYSPSDARTDCMVGWMETGFTFDNFTVAAVGQQYDLMFSNRSYNRTSSMNQSGDDTYNGVDITFKHALSSIVFKVGTDADYAGADLDFKVKKIEIQGVNNKGNFNENLTDGNNENTRNPEWTDQTGAVNYIAFEGSFAVPENGTDRVEPTGAADLILLPQLIPDGAMVVVEYTIETMTSGEITQTATFELKPNTDNNTWTLGKRYTYNIIFGDMEKIYFAPVVEDWDDVESNVDFEI